MLIACHHASPGARERALAKLPGAVAFVAAADGPALASPVGRRIVDLTRPHLPPSFGCVIDAALASKAVAAAADREGVALVIVGAPATRCPALSRIEPDVAVATVGAGAVGHSPSVLDDARWSRAREYLLTAPAAFSVERDGLRVVGAAQADPPSAWLAIDAHDAPRIELAANVFVKAAGGGFEVKRDGDQVVVRGDRVTDDELAGIAQLALAALDRPPADLPSAFDCAWAKSDRVLGCNAGRIDVRSLRESLEALVDDGRSVADGGDVIGLRSTKDAFVLRQGDVLISIDAHRVTSPRELARLAKAAADEATVVMRRDDRDITFRLSE